jgi:hypothetical protein
MIQCYISLYFLFDVHSFFVVTAISSIKIIKEKFTLSGSALEVLMTERKHKRKKKNSLTSCRKMLEKYSCLLFSLKTGNVEMFKKKFCQQCDYLFYCKVPTVK